jgi:hypothetical protein
MNYLEEDKNQQEMDVDATIDDELAQINVVFKNFI